MNVRLTGTVKWFGDHGRSYGFIAGDDCRDYFVSYREILMDGYRALIKGQRVEFGVCQDNSGRDMACNLRILSEAEP